MGAAFRRPPPRGPGSKARRRPRGPRTWPHSTSRWWHRMSDDVIQRLSVEGVDPLALAGVNDANLLELARRLGVRVSLRGDTLSLAGSPAAIERAGTVAQALIDLARMGENLDVHDVERVVADEAQGELTEGRPTADPVKIILPGLRRVIQ